MARTIADAGPAGSQGVFVLAGNTRARLVLVGEEGQGGFAPLDPPPKAEPLESNPVWVWQGAYCADTNN